MARERLGICPVCGQEVTERLFPTGEIWRRIHKIRCGTQKKEQK